LPDDGRRYELIDGEIFMFAGPSSPHQLASGELFAIFREAITLKGLGKVLTAPIEVKFPGDNAVQPDIVVVLNDRTWIIVESGIDGIPHVILEILSPSTRKYDLSTKAGLYARNGVPEFWVVDPYTETIAVHELRDGEYVPLPNDGIARSRIVPGLAVDIAALFKRTQLRPF
jgi:Uma2 family endonuclease